MDLRVYVDGVARIICDLTRTTTVHDIIIALAQYKGKTGRYSLIERAPDGTQRTLSPNEFTHELINHPDWSYILRQNSSNSNSSYNQKRSKSLDGRKTPVQQQSNVETPSAVTSSSSSSTNSTSGHFRTVNNNNHVFATLSSSSSIKSSEKKKRSHLRHIFPLANVNTNNNNNNNINPNEYSSPISFIIEQKRSSRAPIQIIEQDFGILDNHHINRRSRTKSALPPSSVNENSAFHIVHNPINNHTNLQQQQQQQQYIALLRMLKSQEIQVEQQQQELIEKQKEIDHREKNIHQKDFANQYHLLKEHDYRLTSECQMYTEEYCVNELDKELEIEKKLHLNYEHLQQQLTRCSTTLEQKRQLQEQIQLNVEKTHEDIEQIQSNINNDKKDISQYQHELERSNATLNQQEELARILTQRNDEIERILQQRRQQINELENELIKLEDSVINSLIHPNYNIRPNSTTPQHYNSLPSTNSLLSSSTGTTTDALMPIRLQLVNSTLWKLCPSGIWV
ncbi:unnamed protein product [Rotaria sp. Silwood1]|nr:unnamed protein product [Rotaria sp. Silwood1]CAF0939078.1 unnamed protein product [Rotaria sp. Silwood1]CAF3393529.1 unnamed protein product [Rotaria sp. Silwood1]CAF4523670.1 unnamed protein product [Rotaria sp. Silwood1]CAF4789085.1 unnamed protein product [Rotaria sp. Silwood1]